MERLSVYFSLVFIGLSLLFPLAGHSSLQVRWESKFEPGLKRFILEPSPAPGKIKFYEDPNNCDTNAFGETTTCTLIAVLPKVVELEKIQGDYDKTLYQLKDTPYRLTIFRSPNSDTLELLKTENGHVTHIIPLYLKTDYPDPSLE